MRRDERNGMILAVMFGIKIRKIKLIINLKLNLKITMKFLHLTV